jgi:hypothetical protein
MFGFGIYFVLLTLCTIIYRARVRVDDVYDQAAMSILPVIWLFFVLLGAVIFSILHMFK